MRASQRAALQSWSAPAGELGRATAVKLADRGMTVVAVDRNESGLEGLPDGIAREVADATDPHVAAPMVERIVHDVGPPEVLVNTIGAFQVGNALNTTPDLLRLMIDVNLGSALWLSQAVAPSHAEQRLRCHRAHRRPTRNRAVGRHGGLLGEQGGPRSLDPHPRPRAAPARDSGQQHRAATP